VFGCPACEAVTEMVIDAHAQLTVVRHQLGVRNAHSIDARPLDPRAAEAAGDATGDAVPEPDQIRAAPRTGVDAALGGPARRLTVLRRRGGQLGVQIVLV